MQSSLCFTHTLNGNATIKLGIARQVDDTHTPAPDFAGHMVWSYLFWKLCHDYSHISSNQTFQHDLSAIHMAISGFDFQRVAAPHLEGAVLRYRYESDPGGLFLILSVWNLPCNAARGSYRRDYPSGS